MFVVRQLQRKQGATVVAQFDRPNVEVNSSQSPFTWTRAALQGSRVPASRCRSDPCAKASPIGPVFGHMPAAKAERLQRSIWKTGHMLSHPLHPHLHSSLFRSNATKWRCMVTRE